MALPISPTFSAPVWQRYFVVKFTGAVTRCAALNYCDPECDCERGYP